MSLGRKLPSAGSLLIGILVGLVVATVRLRAMPLSKCLNGWENELI
jgi:hypothetical protein